MVHFDEVIGPGDNQYTLDSTNDSRVFLVDAAASTCTGSDSFYINIPSIVDGGEHAMFAEGTEFTFYVTSLQGGSATGGGSGPVEVSPNGSVIVQRPFGRLLTLNNPGRFTLTKMRAHISTNNDTWLISGDMDITALVG